ncbi:peptidase, partial [Paracoccus sp. Z118]|uniref:calcium-binding protein n=1 Tax=Paracoccus sp. Z118 TaxID=2851017 RepID=UPI003530377B|nr:peptidase [Paracoccus sp. Z118]
TAHVEVVRLMGTNNVNAAGNELANQLIGNAGSNQMWGGAGNNTLLGNGGDDFLVGNEGDDWLDGGPGYDRLQGGAGADTFVFATNQGGHAQDFQDDVDTVVLRRGPGYETATLPQLLSHADDVAGGVQFTFGGTVILISGATIATLQDDLVLG